MAVAKLTPLAIAVLELLNEKPMHPYEMTQLMRERYVDSRVKVKAGSLYHTVERLLGNGFVEVVDTQRDGRRPERTVYGMTEAGRDAFTERARRLVGDIAPEYPEILSGLAVLDDLGRDVALHELEHRIIRLRSAVASDRVVLGRLAQDGTPEIYWLDWRFSCDRRTFELAWMERLFDRLRSGEIPFRKDGVPAAPLSLVKEDDERQTG